jgi:hypothetical protein
MTTTKPEATGGSAPVDGVDLAKTLDEISLEQALVDVEIATARVSDLTSRLVAARAEVAEAEVELAKVKALRAENDDLRAQLDAINRSRGYMVVRGLRKLRSFGP